MKSGRHAGEAKCEQADDPGEATILTRVCEVVYRRRRNVGSSELQDIMTKDTEVNCLSVNLA